MNGAFAVAAFGALMLTLGCAELQREIAVRFPPPVPQPEPGSTHLEQGRALLAMGDYAGASRAFNRSLAADGTSATALSGLGVAAEKRGLLAEAQRFFEAAVAEAPNSMVAHNNLGTVYYRQGNYEAARQAFETAFALSSGTSEIAQHNMGLTELAMARRAADNPGDVQNPHRLQRLGSGEYRLTPPAQDARTGPIETGDG